MSSAVVFGTEPNVSFYLGAATVLCAVYMYNHPRLQYHGSVVHDFARLPMTELSTPPSAT